MAYIDSILCVAVISGCDSISSKMVVYTNVCLKNKLVVKKIVINLH